MNIDALPAGPVRALERFNTRHPFSHNDHFHHWVLANLPDARLRALDIGCGEGRLAAELASRFSHVDASEADADMRAATLKRCAGLPVSVVGAFDPAGADPLHPRYDAITMIAALHHLPLRPALRRCRNLLSPGGRLLVVGIAAPGTGPKDAAWLIGSAVANPVMGLIRHPLPYHGPRPVPPFPVRDPRETFAEIAAVAREELPGARLRRRIPFRYTLIWTKPAATA